MFAINEETAPKTKTKKRTQSKTELPETATGQCANRYCGTVLFSEPEDVPGGWIIVWHVDCGGYCPECLLTLSQATMALYGIDPAAREKARHILETIPETASHKVKRDDDDEYDDTDEDDGPDEWAHF